MKKIDSILHKLQDSDPEVREKALDDIGILKPEGAIDLILPLLFDPNIQVRETAACNMGLIHDKRAVPHLINVVNSDVSEKVRSEALLSLAEYRGTDILACLIVEVARKKQSRRPRQEVAKQLKHYDTEDSIRCLVTLMQDDDVYVRIYAADSLYVLNKQGLEKVWLGALEDTSDYVFQTAKKALSDLRIDHTE